MQIEMENIGGSIDGKSLSVDQYSRKYKKIGNHVKRFVFFKKYFEGKKILDYGCGYGIGASLLEDSYSRYVGIDTDTLAIEYAGKNFSLDEKINFYPMSKMQENEFKETFDVGICFEVLEHAKNPLELLDNLTKMIAKGGVLIISTPNGKSSNGNKWLYRSGYHINEYGPTEFYEILSHFGGVELFGERRIDRLDLIYLRKRLKDVSSVKVEDSRTPISKMKDRFFRLAYNLFNKSYYWSIYRTTSQAEEVKLNSSTLIGVVRLS